MNRLTLDVDVVEVSQRISSFVASRVKEAEAVGVALRATNTVDSCALTLLCVNGVGADRVFVFTAGRKPPETLSVLAEDYGFSLTNTDLTEIVDQLSSGHLRRVSSDANRRETVEERASMLVVHEQAGRGELLVAGATNRTRLLMGHFLKFVDTAVDILPLAGLYETQVRQLARWLKIPLSEFDEMAGDDIAESIGLAYEQLDAILYGVVDLGMNRGKVASSLGLPASIVNRIYLRYLNSESVRTFPDFPTFL